LRVGGETIACEQAVDALRDLTRECFDMSVRVSLITEVETEIGLELGSREPNKTRAEWPAVSLQVKKGLFDRETLQFHR